MFCVRDFDLKVVIKGNFKLLIVIFFLQMNWSFLMKVFLSENFALFYSTTESEIITITRNQVFTGFVDLTDPIVEG